MKIGFYKPFIKVYIEDDTNDMNATSYEVVNVMKIFEKFGHQVKILSDTDITSEHPWNGTFNEHYDRIILYGGPFKLFNDDGKIIMKLKYITERLDYILTDLRCTPPSPTFFQFIDNFYSQSTKDILTLDFDGKSFDINNKYGGVAEFRCFEMKLQPLKDWGKKDIYYYFGGTVRNRIKKYLEYVWRPNVLITGKSEEPAMKFNNRVTRPEFLNNLSRTKYSITFADVNYEEQHFVTPRHYEHCENNIIGFADIDWDKDEHIMAKNDFRRVSSYIELMCKMKQLEEQPELVIELLKKQHNEIKPEYISGAYVYGCLQ